MRKIKDFFALAIFPGALLTLLVRGKFIRQNC
jgi:hypothetical protein